MFGRISGDRLATRRVAYVVFALLAFSHSEAYAYIDPNAGGWLYQMLFPVLIALAGAWAVLRHKIAQFLSRLGKRLRSK